MVEQLIYTMRMMRKRFASTKNPDDTPPKHYITVIGNLTRFYGEFELECDARSDGLASACVALG